MCCRHRGADFLNAGSALSALQQEWDAAGSLAYTALPRRVLVFWTWTEAYRAANSASVDTGLFMLLPDFAVQYRKCSFSNERSLRDLRTCRSVSFTARKIASSLLP